MGRANFARTETLCTAIDRAVASVGIDAPSASGHFFFLKTLVDALTIRVLVLRRILDEEEPRTVRIGRHPSGDTSIPPTLYFPRESIYASLLPSVAPLAGADAEVVPLPDAPRSLHPAAPPPSLRGSLQRTFAKPGRAALSMAARAMVPASAGMVLVLDGALVPALLPMRGARLLYWDPETGRSVYAGLGSARRFMHAGADRAEARRLQVATRAGDVWDALLNGADLRACFRSEGVDALPVAKARMQTFLSQVLPEAARNKATAEHLVRENDVRVVVAGNFADIRRSAVAEAARRYGAKVVTVQHGAYGYFSWPMIRYTDGRLADDWIVWGEGVKEHVAALTPETRVIPLGSLKLDALRERLVSVSQHEARKRLNLGPGPVWAYVLTNMMGNARYLADHTTSDHRHHVVQRRILSVFQDASVQLVVKLHPTREHPESPIVDHIADDGLAHIHAVKDEPSWLVMAAADAFVIDSPATAFLEMLITGKPVYLFNDFFRWAPGAVDTFPPHVHFSSDLESFLARLRSALGHPPPPPRVSESEFLRRYATAGSPPGSAGARLARHISEVAHGSMGAGGRHE